MSIRTGIVAAVAAASIALSAPAWAARGSDGQLNIIYWQAVSTLNPFLSGGTKEQEAASMILEPLARYNERGEMVPYLATEIPTVENGGVSADLRSITWNLRTDIVWSDGTPFTAADAVFTADYCMHPEGGCAQLANFNDVETVEAIGDHQVRVTFSVAKPFPYAPLVGAQSPILQKAQFENCTGARAPECTDENFGPIGTGPFRVAQFKPNDVIEYEANPHYRDPAKPAFASVVFKGGGDSMSAARSVLETGEFDYAWNIQVEPEILAQMKAAGLGEIISSFGTSVERFEVNLTNPDPALGDMRSTVEGGPHPFLVDRRVTRALSLAIDREILVEAGYGDAGQVTCNLLPAPPLFNSTNNDWCRTQDIAEANRLLDEAGWLRGSDGVREKDGVRMEILYQTSTNSVRQGTQALIKQMWSQIGVETELRNIDPAVFFGGDPGSPDTIQKLYADVEMFTSNYNGIDPEFYLGKLGCGDIPSPANQWQGSNRPRHCDPAYEDLLVEMSKTAGLENRAKLAIQMNDMIINSGAIIPLIHRGDTSARSLKLGGVKMNSWDSELWNIADWYRM